jgi:beta-galactosidase
LFVNKKSLGKKTMPLNSHLEWQVNYVPGVVEAVGYKNGKRIASDKVQTTKEAVAIQLAAERNSISANATDVAMLTVDVKDKNGLRVPVADNEISFTISGPGKIIGVGNGNPTSLEPDKYLEDITVVKIDNIKEKNIEGLNYIPELLAVSNDADWKTAFTDERDSSFAKKVKALLYSADFVLPELTGKETITLFYNNIGEQQSIYVNGKAIALDFKTAEKNGYVLDPALLHKGKNSIAIAATPLIKKYSWDNINTNPGLIQVFTPAPLYKRKLFNGLAQVIVQSTNEPGNIIVTATGKGVQSLSYTIETR